MTSHPTSPATTAPTQPKNIPQTTPIQMTKRAKPSNVQTSFLPPISSSSLPVSAMSVSTANSSSIQASPVMTPESALLITNNSSIQGSPEGLRGRDSEMLPPQFELPDSIVSRKSSQSAMSEALRDSKSPGIIRRISNRASKFANGRTRKSSTSAMSRDNSTGPVIMRRRSDSTNTAPEGGRGAFFPDSDDDMYEEPCQEDPGSIMTLDYPSPSASISSQTAVPSPGPSGPVVPSILLQGTTMTKVTKNKKKLLTFVLQNEAAKVSWKNRIQKSFYIDDITDIRVGADAQNYRREFGISDADEPRFFSVIYADKSNGRATKALHLIANDEQTFDLWTSTLDAISKHRQDLMASLSSFHEKAVKAYWRTEMSKKFQDKPHSEDEEDIDIVGVERLCRSLHIHGSATYLHEKFHQADVTRCGRLNFIEFQDFVKLMKRREDVNAIYRELVTDSQNGMTLGQFITFLKDVQGEDVDTDRSHWETVFMKLVRQSKTKEQRIQETADGTVALMNESALSSYIISTYNVPLKTAPIQQDSLNRPMHEYYISSSHNTYLLGRQVAGQSSIEAYISALSNGCRCVEVDCWNGADGQPVVMHGRTLTTQVSFADVMTTISKYAFVKSRFPLWISLEVHCSGAQQEIMAQIIKDACGSKLITAPLNGDYSFEHLPSPEQLQDRILIKVKQPKEAAPLAQLNVGRSRGSSLSSPFIRPVALDNAAITPTSLQPPSPYLPNTHKFNGNINYASEEAGSMSSGTSDSENAEDVAKAKDNKKKYKTSNIVKVLGDLGVYSSGIKFHGFDDPKAKQPGHIFSFMEQTFEKYSKTAEDKRGIMRHNMRYMMRTYPNAWRVASTNFDPLEYWRRGVQMAALNWQTYDLGMQLNDAMFAGGEDQSGYVLKPKELREIKMMPTVPEEAGIAHVKRERKNVNFSIDVISAQQLMRPKNLALSRSMDPYIEVEVYHADDKSLENQGVVGEGGLNASGKNGSSIGVPHRRRTQIVKENGFNPIFDKKFNFHLTTKYPDLVFVRYTVRCASDGGYSDRGPPLATYTAKLSSLQQGYRTLPLRDNNGDRFLFSTLFCRIKIEPLTSIYVNSPETESVSGLKGTVRTLLNRSQMSPKPTMETT